MLIVSKKEISIHSILIGMALLLVIVGGGVIILHDSIFTLDDATIIQSSVGSGRMMHVWNEPGFQPKAGRFFPLAYMHTNLVLLFTDGYISAKPLFILNFIMWIGFVLMLFFLCYCVLNESLKSKVLAACISLLVLLVICQRTFYNFTVLWTTFSIDNLLSVLFCVCFFHYLKSVGNRRLIFGLGALLTMAYFSFCIEVNVVLPFAVGLGLLLAKKKNDFLTISSFIVFLLFLALYCTLIMPHAESYYDSSHGTDETILSNAIKMLLLQKLLIVMLIVLAIRFFKIVVKKDDFDPFSDTLLLSSAGYTCGCFALRLNWGLYYTIPIVLALPAMLKLLDFNTVRKAFVSWVLLAGISLYYIVKYPKLCNSIYEGKIDSFQSMSHFDETLKKENAIVWYEDETNPDNKWKKCHVGRSLKHLKENDGFELMSIEDIAKGKVVLMPNNTDISELKNKYANLCLVEKDKFAGFVLYQVN